MTSANDVLQVISQIHQHSILLLELKDSVTLGILHAEGGKLNYFRVERKLGRQERADLVHQIHDQTVPVSLLSLPVEEFLREIEGKRTRHIWFETVEPERKEHGFISISELKAFLRKSQ
jgi:hypothetical protein